jgi:hypothetical protein
MFHTYVRAASGNVVDFDRASFLMDRDLLDQAIRAMRHEQATQPRPDAPYGAQWVWDHYCELHLEHYGKSFVADANPRWDRENPPAASSPAHGPGRRR